MPKLFRPVLSFPQISLFSWQPHVPTFLAAGLAVLPKCPLCLMGILGVIGVGTSYSAGWLQGLTVLSLALVLGVLAVGAIRWSIFGPLAVGLVAAAAVWWGKYQVDSEAWVGAGVVLLVSASTWSALSARRCACLVGCHSGPELDSVEAAASDDLVNGTAGSYPKL